MYLLERQRSQEEFAVKVLHLERMSQEMRNKYLPQELKCLKDAKHENCVRTFNIYKSKHRVYIIMEFAPHGDISHWMERNNGVAPNHGAQWFLQACKGLRYLHETLHMTHRDLKCENILLAERYVAKLVDFGFAKKTEPNKLSRTYCGSMPYECPNKLGRKPYDAFKSDVWSMGVVLYGLLHNRLPFHYHDGSHQMLREMHDYPRYIRNRCRSDLSVEGVHLIEKMLDPNEKMRVTLLEAINNPWINHLSRIRTPSLRHPNGVTISSPTAPLTLPLQIAPEFQFEFNIPFFP